MPAEFQRVTDSLLSELPCAHAIIDDILKLSKGSKNIALFEKILKKLDKENRVLKLEKCKYTIKECEWLAHRITISGIIHLVRKTERIDN